MCEPKPITLSRISFLKPVTMAMAIIITANPKATPMRAIRIIGLETTFSFSLEKAILCAIKSS